MYRLWFCTYQPKKRQRKKGARLPQENGHPQRPQRYLPPPREGYLPLLLSPARPSAGTSGGGEAVEFTDSLKLNYEFRRAYRKGRSAAGHAL